MNEDDVPLSKKTILLVNAGSRKKKFILAKLYKLGLNIIVLNPRKEPWAVKYVKHWIIADNENQNKAIEAVENFLNGNPHIKLDGILTFWEDDVLLCSKLTDKYKLCGIPYKVAKKIRNKYLFRKFCQENGIAAPKHGLVRNLADIDEIAETFSFPLVIKPTYGSSSAFVVKAEDKAELVDTFNYVKDNISTTTESALHEGLEILVEEYIDGEEVDIDMLLQNGKLKFFSITDNFKTKEPFFVETGQSIPSNLPVNDQQALVHMAERTLEKLGVQDGCIHFEAKSTPHGPVPIEINLRMGGDEVYSFVRGAWRVDLIENAVKIATGAYLEKIIKPSVPFKYLVGQYFLSNYSGILVKLDLPPALKDNKYLEEVNVFKKIGEPLLVPPEGYEYLGWVTASGENSLDAEENLNELLSQVRYKIVKFDPASSLGKTLRLSHFSLAAINKNIVKGAAKIEKIRRLEIKDQRNLHIGIAGNVYTGDPASVENNLTDVSRNIEQTLQKRGYKVTFFDFNRLGETFNAIRKSDVNLIFNVCERINNSSLLEPHAAALFDALQIPYTGSNPFTLSLCLDKIRVKKLLAFHNIPMARWDYAYAVDDEISENLHYPLIVKPANTDNSIGITNDSVVSNREELNKQIHHVTKELGRPALVEEYIEGDEYDVSIMGSEEEDERVLPLSRSVFKMPKGYWNIYPYDAKFLSDRVYKKNIEVQRPPKKMDKKLETLLSEIALDVYNILDCHDYGRVEIRVDKNNNPYVLELNPNPSINIGDCVPSVAELVGLDYGDFLEEIIRMCITRYKNKPPYYHLQGSLI